MTAEKLISVFEFYQDYLKKSGIKSSQYTSYDSRAFKLSPIKHLEHIAWMCETAITFVNEGRIEKAMRWLGFIQGVLFMTGWFTLDELKNHSRP